MVNVLIIGQKASLLFVLVEKLFDEWIGGAEGWSHAQSKTRLVKSTCDDFIIGGTRLFKCHGSFERQG
jgi:hypothetical protein